MLDTDTCIDLIRERSPVLIRRLVSHEVGEVGVSAVTLAELEQGVERSAKPDQNRSALEQFLTPLLVADFDAAAARCFGRVRARQIKAGNQIGIMDALIGAHALSLGATVVTRNRRDFARVHGLQIENWLE